VGIGIRSRIQLAETSDQECLARFDAIGPSELLEPVHDAAPYARSCGCRERSDAY